MTLDALPGLEHLTEIVRTAAARELMPRFGRIRQQLKTDGSIVTEADLAMQSVLQTQLRAHWPQIAFLGEEMSPDEQLQALQQSPLGVWVVDPLDGTSNFSLGIPCFAVSIALILDARVVLGLVYDPVRDECFSARLGQGAWLNDERMSLASCQDVDTMQIGLVDFKRLSPELATKLIRCPPYKSQRSFGSVALEWCWIAAARGDVYLHGKQKLWDYAAGQLILAEAGGYAATLEHEPVYNGTLQPRSAALAINAHLFQTWLAFLQS